MDENEQGYRVDSPTMERMWRERALELAVELMKQIDFEFDNNGHALTLEDYEVLAIGSAERLMYWARTGRDPHTPGNG